MNCSWNGRKVAGEICGDPVPTACTTITLIARFTGLTWGPPGPTGPRWAPCWHHDSCYLGTCLLKPTDHSQKKQLLVAKWTYLSMSTLQHQDMAIEWCHIVYFLLIDKLLLWNSTFFQSLTCRDRIIPVLHRQYHDCWYPGSLCRQDISIHDIEHVE